MCVDRITDSGNESYMGWAAQSLSQEVPMTPFTSTFIASNNYRTICSQLGKIIPCICSVASLSKWVGFIDLRDLSTVRGRLHVANE